MNHIPSILSQEATRLRRTQEERQTRSDCDKITRAIKSVLGDQQPQGYYWEQDTSYTPGNDDSGEWSNVTLMVVR